MNYYEHHLGDYAKDAGHLSMIEDGAYRRLIDAYYSREKALPSDVRECCKLARAVTKPERDAVSYVLREFFELTEAGWVQHRCEKEITRFQTKQDKARQSANARWQKDSEHSERNASASANAMRTHSEGNAPRARPQTPDTSNQKSQDQKLPPDGGGEVGKPTPPPADLAKRQQERLRQVAEEARLAFNAALGKPNGLLASVRLLTPDRIGQVKRCLTVARAICQAQYGSERVTADFWADYFAAAAADDFHAGRQAGGPGHENWQPDFEYLTRPATMSKLFDRAMADVPMAQGVLA